MKSFQVFPNQPPFHSKKTSKNDFHKLRNKIFHHTPSRHQPDTAPPPNLPDPSLIDKWRWVATNRLFQIFLILTLLWWKTFGGKLLSAALLSSVTFCLKIFRIITEFFVALEAGPWWWSSDQHSRLLLQRSEFESRWLLNFSLIVLYEKTKINKRGREWPIKKI